MNMFDYGVGDVVECVRTPTPFYDNDLTKGKVYIVVDLIGDDGVKVMGDNDRIVHEWKSTFVRINRHRLKRMQPK